MAKSKIEIPEDKLKMYDDLVASNPKIQRKGATMPYTSHNGHMFSFMAKDGRMSIRLPKDLLQEFLLEFETELSVQHGAIMREYAIVPDSLLKNQERISEYLVKSFEYVKTLKPKPTKRK